MSLYLKYRPQHFGDVVGQTHITDILLAQAAAVTFSHNYLLYGPRGTGKTTTARLLAKIANATTEDLITDPIAQLIDAGHTLDFVEIDAASHTGVDNIREEIIDKAVYPPTHLRKKVYVIDEVHMLSTGAFNALLKIMEEPPAYLMFVLATTEINKVPDTIISRCQVFNFKRIGLEGITGRLKYIADTEGITYEEEGLRLIAKLSSGALRDAIKFLEQVSMLGKVTAEHVSTFLGVVSDSVIEEFMGKVISKDQEEVFVSLDTLYDGGTDLIGLTKDILLWLDEHFIEDPVVYSDLATLFTQIYTQIKRYPYPVLVYKLRLHTYFTQDCPSETISSQAKKKVGTKPALEKKEQKKEIRERKKGEKAPEEESKEIEVSTDTNSTYADLMQRIIEKVDKIMIKSILKQNAMIESIDDEFMHAIVVNQQYYTTLQKTDIVTYLQDIVSEVRGIPTQIKRTYMTKEDYLQKALS